MMKPQTDYDKARNNALEWISKTYKPFTIDDIRKHLETACKGLILTNSSWGKIMQELAKDKSILDNGYVEGIRPNGKKKVIKQWISREYHIRQSNNAKGDKLTLKMDL